MRSQRKCYHDVFLVNKDVSRSIHSFILCLLPLLVQGKEERPEDCIPDLPENKKAREFLAKAPTRGLWCFYFEQ